MLSSVSTITGLSILGQLVAFLRMSLIAAGLGISQTVDAYNLGLIIPALLITVISSWLQVGYLGRYTSLLSHNDVERARAYRSRMLSTMIVLVTPWVVMSIAFAEPILGVFLPIGQTSLAATALESLAWIVLPVAIADFMGLTLNGHGRFKVSALAPLANAAVAVLALWLWPTRGLDALVWSLVIGSITQVVIVLPGFVRLNRGIRPATGNVRAEVVTTIKLGIPIVPAVMLANAASALMLFHVAQLGEGLVAVFGYATRLHSALSQILVIGLGTVLLPHLADLWARQKKTEILILFRKLARGSVYVALVIGVGIFLMGDLTVTVLFARGEFEREAARQVAVVWMLLALSLFPLAFGTFVAKLFSALRQPHLFLLSGGLVFSVTWVVCALGAWAGEFNVIALANVAAFSTTAVFWMYWLSRYLPVGDVVRDIVVAGLWSAVSLIPAFLLDGFLARVADDTTDVLQLLLRAVAFAVCVIGFTFGLRLSKWLVSVPLDGEGTLRNEKTR